MKRYLTLNSWLIVDMFYIFVLDSNNQTNKPLNLQHLFGSKRFIFLKLCLDTQSLFFS